MKRLYILLAIWYVMAQVADAITTQIGIRLPYVVEANPLFTHNIFIDLTVKIGITILVVASTAILFKKSGKDKVIQGMTCLGLMAVCLLFTYVVISNYNNIVLVMQYVH